MTTKKFTSISRKSRSAAAVMAMPKIALKAQELASEPPKKKPRLSCSAPFTSARRNSIWPSAIQKGARHRSEKRSGVNYYGYMLADRGVRLDEATSLIHKALELEPANGAYLDSLGWAYYKQDKLAEEEEFSSKAVDRDAEDPTILGHLGDVYAEMGRMQRAEALWGKALRNGKRLCGPITKPTKSANSTRD